MKTLSGHQQIEAFNPREDLQSAIRVLKRLDRKQPWWPQYTRMCFYYEQPAVENFLVRNRLVSIVKGTEFGFQSVEIAPGVRQKIDGESDYATLWGCDIARSQRVIDAIVSQAGAHDSELLTITKLLEFSEVKP